MTKESHPYLILLLAAIIATTPLAIDMYLPAMPVIAEDLNTHICSTMPFSLLMLVGVLGVTACQLWLAQSDRQFTATNSVE